MASSPVTPAYRIEEVSKIVMLRHRDGQIFMINNRLDPWGMVVHIHGNLFDDPWYSIEVEGVSESGNTVTFMIDIPKQDVVQTVHCHPAVANGVLALTEFAVNEEQRLKLMDTASNLLKRAGL